MSATTSTARLLLPEGWHLDEDARSHLEDLLRDEPDEIAAVVIRGTGLAPGMGLRVHNQHLGLAAAGDCALVDEIPAPVAALTRDPTRLHTVDGTLRAVDGSLLVCHDICALDPALLPDELLPAVSLGRSPFPWRPTALVMGFSPSEEMADWASRMVDELIGLDVEARLAIDAGWRSHRLTAACLPCVATLDALAPDVIIALDDHARDLARGWSAPTEWTTVARVEPDTDTIRWLAWSEHPLRAVVGTTTAPEALAAAIRTLCAEPHPLREAPPPLTSGAPLKMPRVIRARRSPPEMARRRSVAIVTADGDRPVRGPQQSEVLARYVRLVGDVVTERSAAHQPDELSARADLAIVVTGKESHLLTALAEERSAEQLPTVAVLTDRHLHLDGFGEPVISPVAARLARSCGRVLVGGDSLRRAFLDIGIAATQLPWLTDPDRARELRAIGTTRRPRAASPTLGWSTGLSGTGPQAWLDAAARGVVSLLEEIEELTVEVVGDPMTLPPLLLSHPRVVHVASDPRPVDMARWAAHLWSPGRGQVEVLGAIAPFVETSLTSVPSILHASTAMALGHRDALGQCAVDSTDPADWLHPLRLMVTDRTARARQVRATTTLVAGHHDERACAAVVARCLDWAAAT
jgi:hypothetical protein